MAHELVGYLEDEGMDPSEISDMLTPMEYDSDDRVEASTGAGVDKSDALRAILTVARDSRTPPGPQIVVPPGGASKIKGAKAVRVDTEASYKHLRRTMKSKKPLSSNDAPQDAPSIEDLSEASQNELLGYDFYRGDRNLIGDGFYRGDRNLIGDGFYRLGVDQACVVCGADGGAAICSRCSSKSAILGAFGDRGSSADIYGDVAALSVASDIYGDPEEDIPLSFSPPEAAQHIVGWQNGQNLYSTIRITGWDRQPRLLTASLPYSAAMAAVVGYAARAGVAPTALLSMAHPLAQQIGAGSLVPRLCAGSPRVLKAVHKKAGPLIVTIAPDRG